MRNVPLTIFCLQLLQVDVDVGAYVTLYRYPLPRGVFPHLFLRYDGR